MGRQDRGGSAGTVQGGTGQWGGVGYLRSSYNDGGFNAWAQTYLSSGGYYDIFAYDDEQEVVVSGEGEDAEHGFYPDWDASEARCQALLEQARALPPYHLMRTRPDMFTLVAELQTASEALDTYIKEHAPRANHDFDIYSNRDGLFFSEEPFQLKAVMWVRGSFDKLEAVLITESASAHAWYIKALEDCLNFITFGREKQGWLRWSS